MSLQKTSHESAFGVTFFLTDLVLLIYLVFGEPDFEIVFDQFDDRFTNSSVEPVDPFHFLKPW